MTRCGAIRRNALAGCAALSTFVVLLSPLPAAACQIPVFRYALERWQADPYQLLVLHRGPLKSADAELLERLKKTAVDTAKPVNLEVLAIDLAASSADPTTLALQKQHAALAAPHLVLRYPHLPIEARPAWSGPLSAENVAAVADSPLRREIVRRLVDGQSAVWVLLESGQQEQDTAAAATLDRELKRNAQTLKLPDQQVLEADEFYRPDTKVALRVDFSLVRLSRNDPAEAVLRGMLAGSEPDLKEFDAPIAVPVFGRGRACFPLVGKGINAQQIEDNCRFIIGRCSCQVKRENPGIDLVIAADWNKLVGVSAIGEQPLPELSGLGVLLVDPEPAGTPKPGTPEKKAVPAPDAAGGQPRNGSPEPSATSPVARSPALPPVRTVESSNSEGTAVPPPVAGVTPPVVHVDAIEVALPTRLLYWVLGLAAAGVVLALAGTIWLRARRSHKL